MLPRVLFVSAVVFAFPKAASLEQHVGLGLVSWQTGDTVFSEAALCCTFHPTQHAFLDVFIVPRIAECYICCMLESRSQQFTWEDEDYYKHETWKCETM